MALDKPKGAFGKFFDSAIIGPLVRIPKAAIETLAFENPIQKIAHETRNAVKDTLLLPFRVVGQIAGGTARAIWSLLKGVTTKTPFIPLPSR